MLPEWSNEHLPGYNALSEKQKSVLTGFTLLRSLFEAQVLANPSSGMSIQAEMNGLNYLGLLNPEDFAEPKEYFTRRYADDGKLNERFKELGLKKYDNPALIERVLKNQSESMPEILTALLVIVFRYANNFFQEPAWAQQLDEALADFEMANQLLMQVLEIQRAK
jgi:hypothetical protein